MSTGSIELPSACIAETAQAVAGRYKTIAGVMFLFDAMFVLGGIAMLVDNDGRASWSTLAAGLTFWVALFTWLGLRAMSRAAAAHRAGAAAGDRSIRWFLDGRVIAAADAKGTPRPELALKVSAALRTALVAVPRAQLVSRSDPSQ